MSPPARRTTTPPPAPRRRSSPHPGRSRSQRTPPCRPLPPGSATLTASPNPAVVGGTVEFAGCGYDPGGVTIVASGPEAVSWFGGPVDSSGCIDVVWLNFAAVAGSYGVG